jgi:hypothetical protein
VLLSFLGKGMERELKDRAAAYNGICGLEIIKNTEKAKRLEITPLVA